MFFPAEKITFNVVKKIFFAKLLFVLKTIEKVIFSLSKKGNLILFFYYAIKEGGNEVESLTPFLLIYILCK